MKVNWENRFRDGLGYAVVAGFSFLVFAGGGLFGIPFAVLGYYCAVKAIGRWFPDFFGDVDYTVYRIKKAEDKRNEMLELGDAVAEELTPEQMLTKGQPSSKDFWAAQKAGTWLENQQGRKL